MLQHYNKVVLLQIMYESRLVPVLEWFALLDGEPINPGTALSEQVHQLVN
jgi:hypothetical protein